MQQESLSATARERRQATIIYHHHHQHKLINVNMCPLLFFAFS